MTRQDSIAQSENQPQMAYGQPIFNNLNYTQQIDDIKHNPRSDPNTRTIVCQQPIEKEEEFDSGKMRAFVMKSRNGRPRFIVPMNVDYGNLRMTQSDETFEE